VLGGGGAERPHLPLGKTRKRKDGANAHVEGQAPEDKQTEGMPNPQEPGPSQEGKKKRKTKPTEPEPESSDYESDESESEWKGTSKWQHNVPQSLETPDFVNLSVLPSFKKIMWGGGLC
jgi:hypothetical protein